MRFPLSGHEASASMPLFNAAHVGLPSPSPGEGDAAASHFAMSFRTPPGSPDLLLPTLPNGTCGSADTPQSTYGTKKKRHAGTATFELGKPRMPSDVVSNDGSSIACTIAFCADANFPPCAIVPDLS